MPNKNLKKNPTEKPVAKVNEKMPDTVKKEKAPKTSGNVNEQGDKGKKGKKSKTDIPQDSVKSKAPKDSGDKKNQQGEKGKGKKNSSGATKDSGDKKNQQGEKETKGKKNVKTGNQDSSKNKAPKDSGDKNQQGEKGKGKKNSSGAMKDSGDKNQQGEKGTKGKKNVKTGNDDSSKNKDAADKCLLFIKPIKKEGMREEISNLSKDILAVKFRPFRKSTKAVPILYAILVFADEGKAEKNYKMLQGKKCGDEVLVVDYVGSKSINLNIKKEQKEKKKTEAEELDKLRLCVTGFKSSPTEPELKKLFPKSRGIDIPAIKPGSKSFGFAFIVFSEPNLAKKAFERMQKSSPLVVKYAPKPKPKA